MSYTKKLFSFLLIALVVVSLAPAQTVNADEIFNSSNDIFFYDPDAVACTTATSGPLVGNDNAEKIYKYLVDKGLSGEQAAGVLGNFQQESGFDPSIIQGNPPGIADENYTPVNSVGFGIAQWTFTARQAPLVQLAKSSNRSVIDLSLQLDFLWQELETTHAKALTTLKAETTPERAAYVFHRDFEGSADSEATVIQVRGGNAKKLFEKYQSLTPSTLTGAANCKSGFASGNFISDFTFYNQCDTKWGDRITPSGTKACNLSCGPTSVAMIVKNMTGQNITPKDTINYVFKNNLWIPGDRGTSFDTTIATAKEWGVNAEMMSNHKDINEYKQVLDNGGLIIVAGSGAIPFVPSPQAHFVIIRGITAGGKFIVADPYPKTDDTNEKEWDTGPILDGTFGAIKFSK